MIPHRPPSIVAATLLILSVPACGSDAPPAESGSETGAPGAASSASETPSEIRVELMPLPDYIAEGTVTLTRSGENLVARAFVETHLNQGDYAMHIHEGICAEGGRVVVALTSVEGQELGEGEATTTFPASELSPTASYFVWIHSPTGEPVACADIPPVNL